MTQGILGPRKPLEIRGPHEPGRTLKKTLGWPHLIALGVGAIVGDHTNVVALARVRQGRQALQQPADGALFIMGGNKEDETAIS